ncbi:MAG: hypothetical protein LBL15_06245 [Oscillospiraceae bacterium]|jgi:hypothetical protein|nr:hypothetical protein [Oscillospiraceae bacterium]
MALTFKNIIHKTILVGITFLENDGTFISMIQFSGKIISADNNGIIISSENFKSVINLIPGVSPEGSADTYLLPPDLSALRAAPKGEYLLKSTGEVVINPDLLTMWTVTAPEKTLWPNK